MRKYQNLFITGGAGFIGSAFIRYLLADPYKKIHIINYDLLTYAGSIENVKKTVGDDGRHKFIQGDINDSKKVAEILDAYSIDTIVHFAAETHVDRSIVDPFIFLETNIRGTLSLLEEVKKRKEKIHFHHISTDEVYGALGKEGKFSESSPFNPNSPYSAAKAASDHFVRAYINTYGISATTSHCSNNYGPYQYPEKLIPLMIHNCLMEKPLPIYGEGKNVRDWLYVDDHASAICKILESGRSGEVYDIGGDEELSNRELVELLIDEVAKQTGQGVDKYRSLIQFVADRAGHDFRYAIDSSKMQQELKWSPTVTFVEGLKRTVSWYLENQEWFFEKDKKFSNQFALTT